MTLFVPFEPAPAQRPPALAIAIRAAQPDDLPAIAALLQQRHGGAKAHHAQRFEHKLHSQRERVCVAEHDGRVIAFAMSGHIERGQDHPPNGVPTGWYLLGVIVDEAFRRRGVGTALTHHRLAQFFEVADVVHYFANESNRTSIAFHAPFGFEEIARNIWAPGVTFSGSGVGVLFCATIGAIGALHTND